MNVSLNDTRLPRPQVTDDQDFVQVLSFLWPRCLQGGGASESDKGSFTT